MIRLRLRRSATRLASSLAVVILAAGGKLCVGSQGTCCASARIRTICPSPTCAGEGFENRIAELFAQKLGWKLEYFSFPQRMGFIRNTLRFKLPGEEYRCDLVIGVPAEYDQVSPTRRTIARPTRWSIRRAASSTGCAAAQDL